MDRSVYIVIVAQILFNIPQVAKVWLERNSTGVSAVSWGAFAAINVFWLAYGLLHKEKPIIVSSSIAVVLQAFIAIGAA